ncbi:MAG: 50S ribosomal protein L9 [Bacteroidota bacterium]|nr:50S ribosomal protein L9 [Bacteroidota bacterium]
MEIILKQDISNLGFENEVVTVKPGYARNYLIPKRMAILATESNKKILAENMRQASHKLEKERKEAEATATELKKIGVKLPVKVGTTGKLFGSITNLQISRALAEKGHEIDRRNIKFIDEIDKIGEYKVLVKISKDVEVEIPINVVREEDVKKEEK